jgi:hypothetical protein
VQIAWAERNHGPGTYVVSRGGLPGREATRFAVNSGLLSVSTPSSGTLAQVDLGNEPEERTRARAPEAPFPAEETPGRLPWVRVTSRSNAPPGVFENPPSSVEMADTGSFLPGDFEKQYEQLFAEALEEGEISAEERHRLDLAAAALGLDGARVRRLESALLHAYESHAAITVVDRADPSSLADHVAKTGRPQSGFFDGDDDRPTPVTHLTPIPDENAVLHDRFASAARRGDRDAQFCTAAVLERRHAATTEETLFFEAHRTLAPPRPTKSLTAEAWARLFHPDEDRCTGDVFAVIASAALLGRISAMRRDRSLPVLDPDQRQEPHMSTVSAVRALAWAAATLGLRTPPLFVDPAEPLAFEIVPALPPAVRVGAPMLAGRSTLELAFHCARQLTWFREEHFVCTLVPSVAYLEEVFLAALSIGAPHVELLPEVRARINLVAEAIVPVLDAPRMDRLRHQVTRFLAQGGKTSLRRWAQSAEWTALRAGLLLCGDLGTACDAVRSEANPLDRAHELEKFWASDDANFLRRELGIAIDAAPT